MSFLDQQKLQFKRSNIAIKIIYINVIIFMVTLLIGGLQNLSNSGVSIIDWFVLKNDISWIYKPWTLITYSFFHANDNIFHLISNMVFLYYFGQFFLYYFTEKMFIRVYLLGALIGGMFFILLTNFFPVFNQKSSTLIGASAAIYSIVAAVIIYEPYKEIKLFGSVNIKLWQLATFILIMDLLQIARGNNMGGHLSHFGGALAGYFYIIQFNKGDKLGETLSSIYGIFKKKPKFKAKKNNKPPKDDYEFNAAKKENKQLVDTILDKISKSGYESLTKAEKEFLFNQGK